MRNTGHKALKGNTTSAPMVVKANAAKASAATPKRRPTAEEIAQRSFELFLARGGEHGHDVEDWVQAERDLGA